MAHPVWFARNFANHRSQTVDADCLFASDIDWSPKPFILYEFDNAVDAVVNIEKRPHAFTIAPDDYFATVFRQFSKLAAKGGGCLFAPSMKRAPFAIDIVEASHISS